MPSTTRRRPLPALICLLALLAIGGLVWWRVLTRSDASDTKSGGCPTTSTTSTTTNAPVTSSATLPTPASVTLLVLNSTSRSGLAAKARTALLADGFQIPDEAGNDAKNVHIAGVAQIRYGPGQLPAAKLVRYYLPTATLEATKTTSGKVTVSLGTKYTKLATPAQVAKALRHAGVKLRPTVAPTPAPTGTGASTTTSC